MSCQYALIHLPWIGRAPEDFVTGPLVQVGDTRLPEAGPDQRLLFDFPSLYEALTRERRAQGRTWADLADVLACTPARLTNLRTARLADMGADAQSHAVARTSRRRLRPSHPLVSGRPSYRSAMGEPAAQRAPSALTT
jgi:hypothetical protein